MRPALFPDLLRPEARLNFPDVDFPKKKHAQPGLSDSSADAERQFSVEQSSMKEQLPPVGCSRHIQLPFQGGLVDADSHRGDLDGPPQLRIPDNDVSIKPGSPLGGGRPIVVVGRPSVMRFSVLKGSSDADDKNRSVLFADGVFSLPGRQVRIARFELRGMDEGDLVGQDWLEFGVMPAQEVLGLLENFIDLTPACSRKRRFLSSAVMTRSQSHWST